MKSSIVDLANAACSRHGDGLSEKADS